MVQRSWIGVDFDGTLAHYPVPNGGLGPPVTAMVSRVQEWLANGTSVKIVTARVASSNPDAEYERKRIENWSQHYIGTRLPVTAEKDYAMRQLWDDRCVQVEPNTGRTMIECQDAVYQGNLGERDAEIVQLRELTQSLTDNLICCRQVVIERDQEIANLSDQIEALETRWADYEKSVAAQRALLGLTIETAGQILQVGDWIVTMISGPVAGMRLQGTFNGLSLDKRHLTLRAPMCLIAAENVGLVKRGDEIIYQHPRYEPQ